MNRFGEVNEMNVSGWTEQVKKASVSETEKAFFNGSILRDLPLSRTS